MMNTKKIRAYKKSTVGKSLQMLTCYDYQSACLLNETDIDLILVGDSLGNVVLGYDSTVEVSLEEMTIFSSAVKRGAKNKFVVADLPFGAYCDLTTALASSKILFQKSKVNALKLEGGFDWQREIIKRLTQIGIPVMGHIGLTPQSVHQMGGYFTHGKNELDAKRLIKEAHHLQEAGVFALVLECVDHKVSAQITKELSIPTIGIGAGRETDGQVLVLNDLLKMGPETPPKFCTPISNLYQTKKNLINQYIEDNAKITHH